MISLRSLRSRLSRLAGGALVVTAGLTIPPGAAAGSPRLTMVPSTVVVEGMGTREIQIGEIAVMGGVKMEGHRAYVQANSGRPGSHSMVGELDLSDPGQPELIGMLAGPPGGIRDFAVAGDYAYFLSFDGLHIFEGDFSGSTPKTVGQFPLGNPASSLVLGDGYAYLGANHQVYVVDVRPPAVPKEVTHLDVQGEVWSLAGGGPWLCVHAGGALRAVDLTDPAQPRLGDPYPLPSEESLVRIRVEGSRAFLLYRRWVVEPLRSYYESRLEVLELTGLAAPRRLGELRLPGHARDVQVKGTHAVLAYVNLGIDLVDVADPTKIRVLAQVEAADWEPWMPDPLAAGVGFDGELVVSSDSRRGVRIHGTIPGYRSVLNLQGMSPGTGFGVEWAENPEAPVWTRLVQGVAGSGPTRTTDTPSPAAPAKRFYRASFGP